MGDQFISELIEPLEGVADCTPAGPMLPRVFAWRKQKHTVAQVLEKWKSSGACTHGSGEQYLRKHWYRLVTTSGVEMTIYFERKARRGGDAKKRWWLYTLVER